MKIKKLLKHYFYYEGKKKLSICLFYISLNSFAQDKALITDSSSVYKKGFYLNYEEFRTNSPSLVIDCSIFKAENSGEIPSYILRFERTI